MVLVLARFEHDLYRDMRDYFDVVTSGVFRWRRSVVGFLRSAAPGFSPLGPTCLPSLRRRKGNTGPPLSALRRA
jgi:hypothetical protein